MEFGSSRQADLSEDEQMGKVELQYFSFSSSSSSLQPLPSNPSPWEHPQQMGCCSASAIKCDASEEEEASTRLDLMDTSPRNDDDVRSATVTTHIQKEHMFDKVVTPSDVGKLNRLVIPKQHAEKFFPLDSSSNEKGLLLNFEDRNGKPWRFRYSYWNSSQSYVMTKGWSRFVKDKKLDAGDIVSFQRGIGELGKDRLYIDWRRRPDAPEPTPTFPLQHHLSFHRPIPWSPLLMRPQVAAGMARDHSYHLSQTNNYLNRNSYYNYNGGNYGSNSSGGGGVVNPCSMGSILYLRSQPAAAVVEPQQQQVQMGMGMVEWRHQQQQQQQHHPMVFDSVPVVQGKVAAKRLRLFGVNMECPMTESDDECDILSSTTIQHLPTITIQQQPSSSSSSQSPLQSQFPPIDFLNKGKTSMSFEHKF